MKKNIAVKLFVLLFVLCVYPGEIFASSPGTSVFPFLKINPSARDSGMGQITSLSASGSPESNPAVLPWMTQNEASFSQVIYFQQTNYSYLNYTHLLNGSMALNGSLGYLGVGGLTKTVVDSSLEGFAELGSFTYSDMLASIGFGHRVSGAFSYGVSLRGVQETIDTNSTSGFMMSAGGFFGDIPDGWQLGFEVFNLGPQVKGFDLPSGACVGVGKHFYPRLYGGGEVAYYLDTVCEARVGLEYTLMRGISLRAGYQYPFSDNDLGNFPVNITAGLGINLGTFTFDYAWVPYGDLGQTHRFSLSKKFGKEVLHKEEPRADSNPVHKDSVAICDLEPVNVSIPLAQMTSNMLRAEFVKNSVFAVTDRERMLQILREQKIQESGLADEKRCVAIGNAVSVRYVLSGSITDVNGTYVISANLVDVFTGRVIKTDLEKAENSDGIQQAVATLAWRLSE